MKDVVLLGGVRTPVGMHGGALRDMRAQISPSWCWPRSSNARA